VGSQDELVFRGRFIIARALEGQGNIDDAILELEPLVRSRQGGIVRIKCAIALCRCYRNSGDYTQAIEVGERVLNQLANSPLDASDESVQIAVTLAGAYYLRGDTGQAVRICRKAIDKAETIASPAARAAAYWNASVFESERGSVSNAVVMAERALALMAEGQDSRNLARLRTQVGLMQLQLDPPDVASAHEQLDKAAEELPWCSASPIEIATNELARARAYLLDGELDQAEEICRGTFAVANSEAPSIAAQARAVLGQIQVARGDVEAAKTTFRQAVYFLTGEGADQDAAQLWFDLADLLEDVGDLDAARDAYRSAAASAGLRAKAKARPVSSSAGLNPSEGVGAAVT
jgi:tetratricopeptide (TPR) repeat protein